VITALRARLIPTVVTNDLFTPIPTKRTFEEAVGQLAEAIASGHIQVGSRLPSERALAEAMKVGRPTIREAFEVLARAGVLEIVGRGRAGGAYVRSDLIPPDLIEANTTSLRMSEVAGVLVARRLLEPRVAQLAAVERTDEDVDRLLELVRRQEDSGGERSVFLDLDLRFHRQVGRATHNATVQGLNRALLRQIEKAYDLALRPTDDLVWARIVEEHKEIVTAIARRDPDRAELAAKTHLRILEQIWEEERGYALNRKLPDFLSEPFSQADSSPSVDADDQQAR
jgi:GntR family transcriptional regulator, transcriptional repressor for pyruvate dehydrogenase complex